LSASSSVPNAVPPQLGAVELTESRYRTLFDALDEGFCVIEVIFDTLQRPIDFRFLETNRAFERQAGLIQVHGKLMRDLVPGHEQHWFDIYGRIALTGEPLRFESRAGALQDRWFDVYAFRVDQPEQRHVAVLFSDITQRRRAEAERETAKWAAQESEARLRRIIDNMAGFVAMLDGEGVVLEAGEPALRVGALAREEVLGKKFWDCAWWRGDDQQERRIEQYVREAAAGATVRHDVVVRTPDGARLEIDLMLTPVFDNNGRVTHIIPSGIDISERKRVENALRENDRRLSEAAAALTEADRRKDVFLATLAHELRNPLAPIRTCVQILQMVAADNPSLLKTAKMIDRQVTHLVRLVDDLLDLSRITRGKITLKRSTLNVNEVLRRAVESSDALVQTHGHQLRLDLPVAPLYVEGDADRLAQVFSNLLSNAAKFTPHGGAITVSLTSADGEAIIVVQDTGIGIPAERLESVFNMFEQVHPTGGNDGLGIGLALVRQIVHFHHGSVRAQSEGLNRGSRFTVRLPLLAAVADRPPGIGEAAREGSNQVSGSEHKRRILVVDDNLDAAESLQSLLQLQGHTVLACGSGREALEVVQRFHPDLVLLDLGMPELDGLTTAQLLRRQLPPEVVPRIVALTGWGQEADRQRTREAGIDAHLVKPVSSESLRDLLAS
jgi:PAS domain S-box-containing protein